MFLYRLYAKADPRDTSLDRNGLPQSDWTDYGDDFAVLVSAPNALAAREQAATTSNNPEAWRDPRKTTVHRIGVARGNPQQYVPTTLLTANRGD